MNFTIEHETDRSLRLHLKERLSASELQALKALMDLTDGIENVKVYPATDDVRIRYACPKENLLTAVSELDREILSMASDEIDEMVKKLEDAESARIESEKAAVAGDLMKEFFDIRAYAASVANEAAEEVLDQNLLTQAEVSHRKLGPVLKKRMRNRILSEAVADAILPTPVQLAYHVWQLLKLERL